MLEFVAKAFVWMFEGYVGIGIVFAAFFALVGIQKLDSEARGSGIAFRLLILPGTAAFWPMLLGRWVRGVSEPPVEHNPHRIYR
jgi:hypothetical protein